METGASVQLIILPVAVSCRVSVLSSELEDALRLGISTCNPLLLVIHVSTYTDVFNAWSARSHVIAASGWSTTVVVISGVASFARRS